MLQWPAVTEHGVVPLALVEEFFSIASSQIEQIIFRLGGCLETDWAVDDLVAALASVL